jgi:hypothetical protein
MRKLEIVLGLALATSVAVAFSLWYQLEEERALTTQLRAQAAATVPIPAPRVRDTTRPKEGPQTPLTAAAPATPETAARAESPRRVIGRKEDWQAYQRQLLKDPRYVEALREQRRLTYRLRRENAMRLFGFSAETADAIIDLDIDQELQMMSAGASDSPEASRERNEAAQRDHDAKLLALLGQDRFDRWQTYMETRGTRMQVDRFRAQLNGTDILRDDQVEPLITALAAEQKQMRDEIEEYRGTLSWDGDAAESSRQFRARQLEITRAAHKRMLASAASVLSASQVRRLEDMLTADLAQRATQERMESLRRKMGAAPDSDAGTD